MDLREHFFAIPPAIRSEAVVVRGEQFFVREMTVAEKDEWERDNSDRDLPSPRARLICRTACDANGNLVFRKGDAHRLAEYPISIVEALVDASQKVNKIAKEDLEAIQKNSNGQG
jgi:hypothetical protein